jgi:hypothetical protein
VPASLERECRNVLNVLTNCVEPEVKKDSREEVSLMGKI